MHEIEEENAGNEEYKTRSNTQGAVKQDKTSYSYASRINNPEH